MTRLRSKDLKPASVAVIHSDPRVSVGTPSSQSSPPRFTGPFDTVFPKIPWKDIGVARAYGFDRCWFRVMLISVGTSRGNGPRWALSGDNFTAERVSVRPFDATVTQTDVVSRSARRVHR